MSAANLVIFFDKLNEFLFLLDKSILLNTLLYHLAYVLVLTKNNFPVNLANLAISQ